MRWLKAVAGVFAISAASPAWALVGSAVYEPLGDGALASTPEVSIDGGKGPKGHTYLFTLTSPEPVTAGDGTFDYLVDYYSYDAGGGGEFIQTTTFNFKGTSFQTDFILPYDHTIYNPDGSPDTVFTFSALGFSVEAFASAAAVGKSFHYSLTAVPEPMAWALMLLGFGGLGVALRHNRRAYPPTLSPSRSRA